MAEDDEDAPPKVKDLVRRAVSLLAEGELGELERWTEGRRLTAKELAWVLDRYEVRPVLPSDDQLFDKKSFHFDDWSDEKPPSYGVEVDLWSAGGRTDLQLQLEITETEPGRYAVAIRNLLIP